MAGRIVRFAIGGSRGWRRGGVLGLALLLLGLLAAPAAEARIYWTNFSTNTIGRANLDGTGPNQSFISGATNPRGMAVDGAHIYWANDNNTIGRANLDGTGPNQMFITSTSGPYGVAVDGAHIYWANSGTNSIGRANLDGSGANQSFITGASDPYGVAVDGAHVYWTNLGNSTIGRANLDGTGPNQGFITGASAPYQVAVDGAHVYWPNGTPGTIGRANLDGTDTNQAFITGASVPVGVALDPQPATPPAASNTAPSNKIGFGKLKRNKRRGTATLTVLVPGPGSLTLTGNDLVRQRPAHLVAHARAVERTVAAAGNVKLLIKAKDRKLRKLNRTGKVKVTAKITFTPTGGTAAVATKKITLKKRP